MIGLGRRIAHVLAALKETGARFEVAGYADPEPTGLALLAEREIAPGRAFKSVAKLLAQRPYDLVLIGSPNHLHYHHLCDALDAGIPVFCEKPVVRTEPETLALARRLAVGGPPLYVGLVLRSLPLVREILARVESGELGRIVSIDATEHLHPEHGAYLARNWRRRRAWGGSFLLDKVCHDFDIFAAIAGARAARVASFGGRSIFTAGRNPARAYTDGTPAFGMHDAGWSAADDAFGSDMDVTDHQVAIAEYANGVRLAFHANSQVGLVERRWYVAGTEGTLVADIARNYMLVRRVLDKRRPERLEWPRGSAADHNGADLEMARDLVAALSGLAPFPVTARQSMEAGLTVMAIDTAMEQGQVVECANMWAAYDEACGVPARAAMSARI